jgi:hypothetical protein
VILLQQQQQQRRNLYGARVSEDVKVLNCVASTALPQYRLLQKAASTDTIIRRWLSCADEIQDIHAAGADLPAQRP